MFDFARKFTMIMVLLLTGMNAYALLTIEIDQGVKRGVPIAVVPFGIAEGVNFEFILDEVIRGDLGRTGRFDVKDTKDFLNNPTTYEDIKFSDWRLIQVDYLVIGSVVPIESGKFRVESRLYDVFEEKQIFGSQYPVSSDAVRKTMHLVSNAVFEKITGKRSSFDTKIAYTTTSQSEQGNFEHRLFIADYDGYNPQGILKSPNPIFSPTWSPDSDKIAYSILGDVQSKIWVQELATGNRNVVAEIKGHNRAPNWSPNGSRIAFSNSRGGNSDIYVLTLETGELIRLTKNRQIDTEPAWSPDGNFIVFTSNRGKKAQIYRVRATKNGRVERITLEGESNTGASYSPSGEQLVLITSQGEGNQVGIFDLDSKSTKIVSSTSLDDSANFSPNGDMLMYIVEGTDRHLRILSPDGGVQSRIQSAGGAVKQVAWGDNR